MTDDVTSGSATTWLLQPDRVYVGWRYAQAHPDPGPPPRQARPPEVEPIAQNRSMIQTGGETLLNRQLKIAAAGTGVGVLLFLICAVLGILPWPFAGVALLACACILGITGYSIWQGEQAMRARANEHRARIERERDARQRKLNAAHEEHAAAYREWERRRLAYEDQREWYPVAVPPGVDRVDLVGGTLAGWSAAVTTMGAARLAAGARVTVVDLSEGAVAQDLVRLATDHADDPLVWVLPSDLPRLDITRNLGAEALADVLSLVVSAGEEQGSTRDLSFDNSILERIIAVFGGTATIPQIAAALRALAQVGDPRDDLQRGLITDLQLDRVTTLFGRDASDRIVIRRAWALEAQLRKLETIGTDPVRLPSSRLHVVSMDRRAGVLTNRILGTYVTTALTHRIREAPPGGRWEHTLFLCGAEKLRGDVLDRLIDACEATGTGLVLAYRSITPHVRERLGRRGHAAVGFMRLGNAEDARVAAEHIGTDQPLQVAEITDSAGEALLDVAGEPYASTVVYARGGGDPLTEPVWSRTPAGRHRSTQGSPPDPLGATGPPAGPDAPAPLDASSASSAFAASAASGVSGVPGASGDPDGVAALVDGITVSTAWARSIPVTEERKQRSRELLVEPHQLQELPATAMIFTHSSNGRRIQLVDANPGIMTLPTAHRLEFEEFLREQADQEQRVAPERAAREEEAASGEDTPDAATPSPSAPATDAGPPTGPRARHALPRGAEPRASRIPPPLKPTGKHAANGRRETPGEREPPGEDPAQPQARDTSQNPPPDPGPPPERLDFRRKEP